ncbi:MAG: hypothetical protein HYR72_21205 [Deltaproteobacteria bacterium]|nr:hypothetical protein [Deltaproteobacteria bacterium]MBI3386607.1 hypothetical protein [Deltaproteobacteria bacterium]
MKKHTHVITLGALAVGLVFLAGCGTTKIAYKPKATSAPAATASVALKVVDERPADKGGSTKDQVGQIRGSYGIPSSVKDSSPDVATVAVSDATIDALRQAGIGMQAGGGKTLVATVKHFWMDGMMGYKATVAVQYTLQDSSGKTLWTAEVKGGAGGTNLFRGAESFTQDMFENALSDLANKALEQFKSDAFKKALG